MNTQVNPALLIGRDPLFDLRAVHIGLEAIEVQSEHSRVRIEQGARINGFAPSALLLIEQVMHFPETALEARGLRGLRCFRGVRVTGEGKVTEDYPELRRITVLDLSGSAGQHGTRRTFKIGKLLERDRRIGFSANMDGFGTERIGILGNLEDRRTFGPIEHRSRSEGERSDSCNNDKWKISFHSREGPRDVPAGVLASPNRLFSMPEKTTIAE